MSDTTPDEEPVELNPEDGTEDDEPFEEVEP
jgi:hypothetical protein